jgi:HAMP domain-containing protein
MGWNELDVKAGSRLLRNVGERPYVYFAHSFFVPVVLFVAAEVAIFVLYGRSLVTRLVLRPLSRIMATADSVADGDLAARAPDADTRDFATLAERLNRMTDRLLDAQSQLVRSEKLASIGRLAAGVAHEVGNPLGAVGTYLEVLRRRGGDKEITDGMARELERLDRIVRSLLDYARPQEDPLVPVDPARIVRGAYELLRAQGAFRALNAKTDIFPKVPEISVAHVLEQTLVNLLLNAVDAAGRGRSSLRRWAYERRKPDGPASPNPRLPSERRPSRPRPVAGRVALTRRLRGHRAETGKVFRAVIRRRSPRGRDSPAIVRARARHGVCGVWPARRRGLKLFFPIALPSMKRVLIIDDEPGSAAGPALLLTDAGDRRTERLCARAAGAR